MCNIRRTQRQPSNVRICEALFWAGRECVIGTHKTTRCSSTNSAQACVPKMMFMGIDDKALLFFKQKRTKTTEKTQTRGIITHHHTYWVGGLLGVLGWCTLLMLQLAGSSEPLSSSFPFEQYVQLRMFAQEYSKIYQFKSGNHLPMFNMNRTHEICPQNACIYVNGMNHNPTVTQSRHFNHAKRGEGQGDRQRERESERLRHQKLNP